MVGGGRILVIESMVVTAQIRDHVLNPDETYLIRDVMERGGAAGMFTFDRCLLKLVRAGKISAVCTSAIIPVANRQDPMYHGSHGRDCIP
jgi:Tfp pilus assembly pilus retraction ATPase PilT